MAAFLAKQMVGNQFSAVKADIGGGNEPLGEEERQKLVEEERERLLALQEAEELRKEKHRKLEAEREKMRQGVRDKYKITKKKEDPMDDLRRQQEAEMLAHIAAMNPRNLENRRPPNLANPNGASAGKADDEDFATKLMSGNVSGAAAQMASKVQSLLPQNFSFFKKE